MQGQRKTVGLTNKKKCSSLGHNLLKTNILNPHPVTTNAVTFIMFNFNALRRIKNNSCISVHIKADIMRIIPTKSCSGTNNINISFLSMVLTKLSSGLYLH